MTLIDNTAGSTTVITGGAGFIGSWLTRVLLDYEHKVIVIDDMSTGSMKNLEGMLANKNLTVLERNVSNKTTATAINLTTDKIDYIYHLASPASPMDFARKPIEILDVNTKGTEQMLWLATFHGARLLFTSTSEVYGDPPVEALPLKETYRGNVNTMGVRGCYDEGKRTGEAYCKAYERAYGTDARIARIFNTYGKFMPQDGRVMPTFIERALKNKAIPVFGDGTQTRCFTYITDMVTALLNQMFFEGLSGIPINLGSAETISILSLADKIIEMTDSKSDIVFQPLPEDDPQQRVPDTSRAKKLLDWEPTISLDGGLQRSLEWWRENPVC